MNLKEQEILMALCRIIIANQALLVSYNDLMLIEEAVAKHEKDKK